MTIEEQIAIADGSRFQIQLGELVKEKKLANVVETGSGVSSLYILKAFDDANIDGKLHSIDKGKWYPHDIIHPKFDEIVAKSVDAILPLYQLCGPFDLACSDGNHDILCQTYEFEFLWECLKPGGYLVADDKFWGSHGAWDKFLKTHGLTETAIGDAVWVQKPLNYGFVSAAKAVECHELNLQLAQAAENRWLAEGNSNSEVFKD